MSYDNIMTFLKQFTKTLELDSQTFFQMALGFKISNRLLQELEEFYKTGQPTDLYLLKVDNKTKW